MKRFTFVICLLLLAGCSGHTPPAQPLHVTQSTDPQTGDTVILSPVSLTPATEAMPLRIIWQIKSTVVRESGDTSHALRVNVTYLALKHEHYVKATDHFGDKLRIVQLDSNGKPCADESCPLSETLDVDLPEDSLRESMATGYKIRITARSKEDFEVAIPAEFIGLQLRETDKAAEATSSAE